jgi:hypothetical protein
MIFEEKITSPKNFFSNGVNILAVDTFWSGVMHTNMAKP